jgi:hypothetical protein
MVKAKVVERLEKAWEMLSNRINKVHKEFLKNSNEDELGNNYFISWEEADVPFQFGRFFYAEKDDGDYEFHSDRILEKHSMHMLALKTIQAPYIWTWENNIKPHHFVQFYLMTVILFNIHPISESCEFHRSSVFIAS